MQSRKTAIKKNGAPRLFEVLFIRARSLGLIDEHPEGTIDATGLESRHVSRHYVRRTQSWKSSTHATWPKITLVSHTRTHLIAGAVTSLGPSQDSPDFAPALRLASRSLTFDCLLADAGYDGEHNHRLARRELDIRLTVIKINPRNTEGKIPSGPYRAQMHRRFPCRRYRHRSHAESVISRHKRLLGAALRARKPDAQAREMMLRVYVHDLMILAAFLRLLSRRTLLGNEGGHKRISTEPKTV